MQPDGVVFCMIRYMIYDTCSPKAHTVLNMEKRWRKDCRWSGRLSPSSRSLQQATDYQGSDTGTPRKLPLYSLLNFWKLRSGLDDDVSNRERFEKKSDLTNAAIIKSQRKFGDQVLPFNLCCCHGPLAPFSVANCRPLKSLAAKYCYHWKREKLPVVRP